MHRHITRDDRVKLSALLKTVMSQVDIADHLEVHSSTISREIERGGGREEYSVRVAEHNAKVKRKESKQKTRIKSDRRLRRHIVCKLKIGWSPDKVAGRWRLERSESISQTTIYDWIRSEKRDLLKYLPHRGRKRRKYGTSLKMNRYTASKRSISERPEIVNQRLRIGDWEGDTVIGGERTQRILTYTERVSNYLVAMKLEQVTADIVHKKTRDGLKKLPCQTITYDNGSEFALHRMIERDTRAEVYFAHPGCPGERGSNERANGELRRFFPKGTSFANITERELDRVVRLLNHSPRKSLGYLTPHEYFNNCNSRWN